MVLRLPLETEQMTIDARVSHLSKGIGVAFQGLDEWVADAIHYHYHVFKVTLPLPSLHF